MTHASAPGRVNLIGEHTDYNRGFVLPTPIPQLTRIELHPRTDDRVMVWSRELARVGEYRLGDERRQHSWLDYIQGCTAALRRAGHGLRGAEIEVRSEIPVGSGLSSSAALEVALLRALREAFSLSIDDVTIALLGQRAENSLVGAPVGPMDQLVVSLGRLGTALFIDTDTITTREIPLADADVIVIDSGLEHAHVSGGYQMRRAECEQAAVLLGVRSLRELSERAMASIAALPAPLDRRVRHVVTENARVLAAVEALIANDPVELGWLFDRSHASMRDDFEISVPAIDQLVEIARALPEVYGARLTGGGFGGAIVAIAARGTGRRAAERIVDTYRAATPYTPTVLVAGDLCSRF